MDAMDVLAAYLSERYQEEIEAQQGRRRFVPSIFDGHDVEIVSEGDAPTLLLDGYPYPMEEYIRTATVPDADPARLAELHAKLQLVDWSAWPGGGPEARDGYEHALRLLAAPYERREDFPRSEHGAPPWGGRQTRTGARQGDRRAPAGH